VKALHDAIDAKAKAWDDIVKIGRTHMQDATPITLGQEWSGYAGMLSDNIERIQDALKGVYHWRWAARRSVPASMPHLAFAEAGGGRDRQAHQAAVHHRAHKFTVQGAHDALVQLSGTFRTLAASLYKIANDIRLMSCGPARRLRRAGDPRERARLVDHAGQGQPDAVRGAGHDRRPGDGQRRGGGLSAAPAAISR
jgi:fumarate hydratase class II